MKDSYAADHRIDRSNPRNQLRGYPIISDQISREALEVVCQQLETVLEHAIPGAAVEFGCYIGTTSLFWRRILDAAGQSEARAFHVYDSFEGLPPKSSQDANAAGIDFEAGKLYVGKKEFIQQFRTANLRTPVIHKGWFNQLQPADVPDPIAIAFLDGDFYDSIISSLRLVWPHMSEGGRILIDDYKRETLPGVERAVRDFLQGKHVKRLHHAHNIAIIEL
ncbi:MAG TPA: TylF/MycF/NovP-related O-methyltransferase [Candidatus Saccharimonadales bacterium]|nr:TylF/MycF/NovP-related O-methyltransferase [Candidatus Saccharimonadales bacterium]